MESEMQRFCSAGIGTSFGRITNSSNGATMVEFALVLPIFVLAACLPWLISPGCSMSR